MWAEYLSSLQKVCIYLKILDHIRELWLTHEYSGLAHGYLAQTSRLKNCINGVAVFDGGSVS